ncbi:hypothetical protein [Xanthomonas campestris]|uniref:hypothetical protein n=1 Tax=Xanthomonas campestris TaxID=339 RepID=UPI0023676F08|nr:hypothetical protein [Xanthomonas campestris]WDI91946.1 hypothetical protein JH280_11410 [Xanthomonas campestris]
MNPQSEKKMANGDRLAETMTKREAFAMAAMQGYCGAPGDSFRRDADVSFRGMAEMSVKQANALLAELEKRNG